MYEHPYHPAIEPISVQGRFLFRGHQRFIVRGLVYQLVSGPVRSPLGDDRIDSLRRDIELFKELGINALRVYNIELHRPFEKCMQELANAGIYIVADLPEPSCCIGRTNLRASYTTALLAHFCAKVDVLSAYPNVLGICVSNSLVNGPATAELQASTVITALIQDLKTHMRQMNKTHGNRILPLCVSDTVFAALSTQSLNKLAHPSTPGSAIDFYMLITYDNAQGETSQWSNMSSYFHHAQVPLLVAEYGSNLVRPRPFFEIERLYAGELIKQFSGGFMYEFEEGANGYGLIKLKDGSITKLPDFQQFKEKLRAMAFTTTDVSTNEIKP